jgi:serine/arginine repetitive matrix protein 2
LFLGVLSILDAATNDLALLINTLDLQATPITPDLTPLRPSPLPAEEVAAEYGGNPKRKALVADSSLKKTLRSSMSSISSLRPYAQSRGAVKSKVSKPSSSIIAQQIAPWPTLVQGLSPLKESPSSSISTATPPSSVFRPTHKRTLTPAPESEPEPLYQPLRPAKSRVASGTLKASYSSVSSEKRGDNNVHVPSLVFESRSSSRAGSKGSMEELSGGSLTPVFKRIHDHERKRSSLIPVDRGSLGSQTSNLTDEFSLPIARETRRVLGMSGTIGGSHVSCFQGPNPDLSDSDSDAPDELRVILASHSDRNFVAESLSFQDDEEGTVSKPLSPNPPTDALPIPSSSPLPSLQLPVFHASLIDDEQNRYDIEGMNTLDEDTFDFTGELKNLNDSGGSDRRSFVEQLENASRTPAKVDLCYDFGGHFRADVPPVPDVPLNFSAVTTSRSGDGTGSFGSQLLDVQLEQPTMVNTTCTEERQSQSQFDFESGSNLVDIREPSSLLGSDELSNNTDNVVGEKKSSSSLQASPAPSSRRPSDGQLNRSFKFGGLPCSQSSTSLAKNDKQQPLTLYDIIPPPSYVRSLSNSTSMDEDDSVLNSIFAKITEVQGRPRSNSDASARQIARKKRRSIYKAMS